MSKLNISPEKLHEHEVRLFPTSNIRGETEAEARATASLLSMIRAVSEFAGEFCSAAGGPGGRVRNALCYTEVSFIPPFKGTGKLESRPDGIILIKRGKTEWAAFLEVKVGKNPIDPEQVKKYVDWADEFDEVKAVITISNESAKLNDEPPYELKKRTKHVTIKHFSWERLHAIALKLCQSGDKGIADDDQRWLLNEWVRYLASESSGILSPPELGEGWFTLINAAQVGNLKNQTEALRSTFLNWLAFLRVSSLRLGAKLNAEVSVYVSKKTYEKWLDEQIKEALKSNVFIGKLGFRRSDMNPIEMELRIVDKKIQFSYKSDPWTEGRQERQIREIIKPVMQVAMKDLCIIVDWGRGLKRDAKVEQLKDSLNPLFVDKDGTRIGNKEKPKNIEFRWIKSLQRGRSTAKILHNIYLDLVEFYGVVQSVPAIPQPKPQLPQEQQNVQEETASESVTVVD